MSAPSLLAPGALFAGRFEVGRELGRGGCSVVYAARDRELGADVALKVLVPSPAATAVIGARTRREVLAVRMLSHASIVAVYDVVEDGPFAAIVMELVDGEDLDVHVRRRGPLPAHDVVRIGQEIAAALAAAHRRGILHRDVKPQNILIERAGTARLTDFGSARMDGDATITRTGALVGTIAYMSPEMVAGRRADARSDVFALGMTLHLALVAQLPDRPSPHLPPAARASGYDPCNASSAVPGWLGAIVARATAADPRDRHPTPAAFAEALAEGERRGTLAPAHRGMLESCPVCDAPDPLGRGLCARCGATAGEAADTLIYLEPQRGAAGDHASSRLSTLLGAGAPGGTRSAVIAGRRALICVPASAATPVVERLAEHDLPARAVPAIEAWRHISISLGIIIVAVIVLGMYTGAAAEPMLLLTTLPFAGALGAAGLRATQAPAVGATRRPSALPAVIRERVVRTLSSLPAGTARTLLADTVRRGHHLHRALARRGDARGLADPLDALLEASCAGALELSALEKELAASQAEASATPEGEATEHHAELEQRRDAAVQRLLDAMSVLARLDSLSADDAEEIGARLSALVAELESEARAREQAAREVEALLRPAPR